jgi:hypothetical protein
VIQVRGVDGMPSSNRLFANRRGSTYRYAPGIGLERELGGGANAADQVYLNDGTGRTFSQLSSIPSASQGVAESVWPIDYDSNGLTDFLVLNGEEDTARPVQLIAFFPDS